MAHILLVEDEKSTAVLMKRALTEAGYQVTVATNGDEAVSMAQREMPDIVLMDMSLPQMNGFEASRQIKANAATQRIPILGLSGATTDGDRVEAYDAGCVGYMAKPVDIKILLVRIAELLGI